MQSTEATRFETFESFVKRYESKHNLSHGLQDWKDANKGILTNVTPGDTIFIPHSLSDADRSANVAHLQSFLVGSAGTLNVHSGGTLNVHSGPTALPQVPLLPLLHNPALSTSSCQVPPAQPASEEQP